MSAATMVAGRTKQRQPDWFVESKHLLSPLSSAKNEAWNGVLLHDLPASHRKFRQCERSVKNAVIQAKDDWIQKTAQAADVEVVSGIVSSNHRWFIVVVSL